MIATSEAGVDAAGAIAGSIVLKVPQAPTPVQIDRYSKLNPFGPYKLGLKNAGSGLEVHLLETQEEAEGSKFFIIAKLGLSGSSKPAATVKGPHGDIAVAKPQAGVLDLYYSEHPPTRHIRFSITEKAGKLTVSILSEKISADGHRLPIKGEDGALNALSESLDFLVTPVADSEMKATFAELEKKRGNLEGLLHPVRIDTFKTGMDNIFMLWPDMSAKDRLYQLKILCQQVMLQSNICPCFLPEQIKRCRENLLPKDLVAFNSENWSIQINPKVLRLEHLSASQVKSFAASLYQELRRAEQTWLAMRYVAGRYPLLFQEIVKTASQQEMPQFLDMANFAGNAPIKKGDVLAPFAETLFESMTVETDERRKHRYLLGVAKHSPKLTLSQQAASLFGKPYLPHLIDAQKAYSQVAKYNFQASQN